MGALLELVRVRRPWPRRQQRARSGAIAGYAMGTTWHLALPYFETPREGLGPKARHFSPWASRNLPFL
eukprot:11999649-Heterocapsa_arctica.AAC.1